MLSKNQNYPSMIHGQVEPGFETVREEFTRNFKQRGEVGAACAIYYQGKKVVDLWGGYQDPKTQAPWEEHTMAIVFSTSKGMSAMTLAMLHSLGCLDYEEKVSAYWPEFAQNGKEAITVRQLISHQAGLPQIPQNLEWDTLSNLDCMAEMMARQKPVWEPGMYHGYHALSIGFYENELVRRIDPQHRSLGRFFQEEIASPLGIEFYIGLPEEVPLGRISEMQMANPASFLFKMIVSDPKSIRLGMAMMNKKSLTSAAFESSLMSKVGDIKNPKFRGVEMPSTGGIGEARAIARAYSAFATGGRELGIAPRTLQALSAPDQPPGRGIFDRVMLEDLRHSLGFGKPCPSFPFGRSPDSIGWAGMGGSLGFADPENQVGFGYNMNQMGPYIVADPRAMALMRSFYRCI